MCPESHCPRGGGSERKANTLYRGGEEGPALRYRGGRIYYTHARGFGQMRVGASAAIGAIPAKAAVAPVIGIRVWIGGVGPLIDGRAVNLRSFLLRHPADGIDLCLCTPRLRFRPHHRGAHSFPFQTLFLHAACLVDHRVVIGLEIARWRGNGFQFDGTVCCAWTCGPRFAVVCDTICVHPLVYAGFRGIRAAGHRA
jgi:hypothetical protein